MKRRYRLAFLILSMILCIMISGCNSAEKEESDSGLSQTAGEELLEYNESPENDEAVNSTGNTEKVFADALNKGEYTVAVKSSSSMLVIEQSSIGVDDSGITASILVEGTGIPYIFLGTAEEAAEAEKNDKSGLIGYDEETEDGHRFTFPVEALDSEISVSVYSNKLGKWYDRTLTFQSASLPATAFADNAAIDAPDGDYLIEIDFSGGTGKAYIEPLVSLHIEAGTCTAKLVWSSTKYDYMRIGDVKYLPVSLEPGATFEVPVTGFDRDILMIGDTTAMSKPHEVEYTVRFKSDTLKAKDSE